MNRTDLHSCAPSPCSNTDKTCHHAVILMKKYSTHSIHPQHVAGAHCFRMQLISSCVFLVEYYLRLYTCTESTRYRALQPGAQHATQCDHIHPTFIAVRPYSSHVHCSATIVIPLSLQCDHSHPTFIAVRPYSSHFHCSATIFIPLSLQCDHIHPTFIAVRP